MKVCLINGHYYKSNDGIGRYGENLITDIAKINNSIKLDIVTHLPTDLSSNKSVRVKSSFLHKFLHPFIMELNYFVRFKNNTLRLRKELQIHKGNVYHAVSPSEAVSAVLEKKHPLITTYHDIIPLLGKNRFIMEKFYFLFYNSYAKKSDLIISDSISTKNDLVSHLGIDEEKVKVVYPGIDLEKFKPSKKISNNKQITLLYLGGLVKRKGIYETIYAFHKVVHERNGLQLLIAGVGPEENSIKKIIEKLNLLDKVKLLGFINEERIADTYQKADIFIYLSFYEGFGYTPLEAMASGIPVIASNKSSIPEVVGDAGILVNPSNIKEVSEKIKFLIDNPTQRKILAKKGLLQSKKFSNRTFTKNILRIYNELN